MTAHVHVTREDDDQRCVMSPDNDIADVSAFDAYTYE